MQNRIGGQMKKIVEYLKNNQKVHYIIILIVTCIVAIPMQAIQLVDTDDGKGHISRIIATKIAMVDTNFPHLLTPTTVDNTFGYAINLFYGKLPIYGALLLKIFPISYVNALKLFAILTIFLSGITMYHCVLQMTKKKKIALISAILYMTANYRFEEIYTRFALGEFVTFVFFPIILQGIHNILYENGKKAWLLGIGTAALILSHSISTMYFGMFCLGYVLLQGKTIFQKRIWKQLLIQIALAILLTSFYTIPIIEHKLASEYAIFEPELMGTRIDVVMEHVVEWKKFFTTEGALTDIDLRIGIPICIGLVTSIMAMKKIQWKERKIWIESMCLGVIAMFMCTKYFPWILMPDILYNIQFSWRLSAIVIFFLSIASAIGIGYIIENCKKEWIQNAVYMTMIGVVLVNATIYTRNYDVENTYADVLYEQNILENQYDENTYKNWDYLPVKAYNMYSLNREDTIIILEGTSKITAEEKHGLTMRFTIKEGSKGDKIELPYLFYLGYTIQLQTEGEKWDLPATESKYGFIQIQLPDDIQEGEIFVQYKGTVVEKIGYVISAIGMVLLFIHMRKSFLEKKLA